MRYGGRAPLEDYSAKFMRCSACNFNIRLGVHPGGGIFHPPTVVQSSLTQDTYGAEAPSKFSAGKTKYFYDIANNDASQGCPACGCPLWSGGGKLGDMKGSW